MVDLLVTLNRFVPNSLARLAKSLLFQIKHFSPSWRESNVDLPSEFGLLDSFILLIGHSNYLTSLGGTEKIILEEVEGMLANNLNSVYLYPKGNSQLLSLLRPSSYGIIINGYEVSEITRSQLHNFLDLLSPKLTEIKIHHFLFWSLRDIRKLVTTNKNRKKKISICVHDFYFKCPKVNYFCQSGPLRCNATYLKSIIKRWRVNYNKLFEHADMILAPSLYMKERVPNEFKSKVHIQEPESPPTIKTKTKLAYLGSASDIKGFQTWKALAKNALITRTYDLIQIGSDNGEALLDVQKIGYSFHDSKACIASELLTHLQIDLVLIWSQVPESYSFTYHEAKRAKKYVIASVHSGNVAYSIEQHKNDGIVLDSDYNLVQFLVKKKA